MPTVERLLSERLSVRQGSNLIKGKVMLDTSNPNLGRDGDVAAWAREKGAGLASAELLPGARLVHTFNAVGYARLPAAAQRQGERTGMPLTGKTRAPSRWYRAWCARSASSRQ